MRAVSPPRIAAVRAQLLAEQEVRPQAQAPAPELRQPCLEDPFLPGLSWGAQHPLPVPLRFRMMQPLHRVFAVEASLPVVPLPISIPEEQAYCAVMVSALRASPFVVRFHSCLLFLLPLVQHPPMEHLPAN